jgi:hypothetical protein
LHQHIHEVGLFLSLSFFFVTYIGDNTRFHKAEESKKNRGKKTVLLAFSLTIYIYMHFVEFLSKSIWSFKSTVSNREEDEERKKEKSKNPIHFDSLYR